MDKSGFQFKGFIIKKSFINIGDINDFDLNINFKPSGQLNKKESTFKLNLETFISEKNNDLTIEVLTQGFFSFNNLDNDELCDFLYLNAPAILFPYIRAYITSLTALSGVSPIVLPTLNLSGLKNDLKNNVEVME